jgi:hypothetical protein
MCAPTFDPNSWIGRYVIASRLWRETDDVRVKVWAAVERDALLWPARAQLREGE